MPASCRVLVTGPGFHLRVILNNLEFRLMHIPGHCIVT